MSDDDIFAELVQGIDMDEGGEVEDFTKISLLELSTKFNDARDELFDLEEMRDARTDRGRELHSIRAACLIEMRRRQNLK